MDGLETDVARLTLRVVRTFLDRDRDGLLEFFVGVVLFGATALFYQLTEVFVPARVPMLLLASRTAVARLATAAFLSQGQAKRGSAGGAICEEHFGWRRAVWDNARRLKSEDDPLWLASVLPLADTI